MTELLEKALEVVRRMSLDAQDAVAQAMLSFAAIGAEDETVADDIEPKHRDAARPFSRLREKVAPRSGVG